MADDVKTCPRCAEEIKLRALVCYHCGAEFEVTESGYCETCHDVRAAADGACAVCGGALVDVQVHSTFREPPTGGPPGPTVPPPTVPPPGVVYPAPGSTAPTQPVPGAPPAYPVAPAGPVPVAPAAAPAQRRGCGTAVLWTFGILLLLVGVGGFLLANVADSSNRDTYATETAALGADDASARAATLESRTAAYQKALVEYRTAVAATNAKHNAMVDTVNQALAKHNAGDTAGARQIGATTLPQNVQAFSDAVEAQKAKQAALDAALAQLQEVAR